MRASLRAGFGDALAQPLVRRILVHRGVPEDAGLERRQPDGHGAFSLQWPHFGFEDDVDAMTQRRLRQADLFGRPVSSRPTPMTWSPRS